MKDKSLLILLALLLSACASVATPNPERYNVQAFPSATPVPTRTLIPSPTIGYQATADAYQQQSEYWQNIANDSALTVVALESQHINGTMAADQLTQVVDAWTVTAAANSTAVAAQNFPVTLTYSADMRTADASALTAAADDRTATVAVPTIQAALIQNETDAWAMPAREAATVFFIVCAGLAFLVVVAFILRRWKFEDTRVIPTPVTPFVQDAKDEHIYRRAIVPCTTVELMQFAAGVLKAGKTLAFNQWEGTQIHKRLDGLRRFFIHQRFAIEAPGKGGELVIVAEGEQFLRVCLEGECPPPPFLCLSQNEPLSVHEHEVHTHEDGGGVGEPLVGEVWPPAGGE